VPTISRFRDIQNSPEIEVKPLKNKRLLSFLRPGMYCGSQVPTGVRLGVDFSGVGVFPFPS